jgi:hypothetical protein
MMVNSYTCRTPSMPVSYKLTEHPGIMSKHTLIRMLRLFHYVRTYTTVALRRSCYYTLYNDEPTSVIMQRGMRYSSVRKEELGLA